MLRQTTCLEVISSEKPAAHEPCGASAEHDPEALVWVAERRRPATDYRRGNDRGTPRQTSLISSKATLPVSDRADGPQLRKYRAASLTSDYSPQVKAICARTDATSSATATATMRSGTARSQITAFPSTPKIKSHHTAHEVRPGWLRRSSLAN